MGLTTTQAAMKRAVEQFGGIKAVASACGVHPSMISAVLRGVKQPGPAICGKLGIPHPGGIRRRRSDAGARRPRRPRPQVEPIEARPDRPEVVPESWREDEEGRRQRAAEIRAERMPKAPVVKVPTWDDVVTAHLRAERRLGIGRRAS